MNTNTALIIIGILVIIGASLSLIKKDSFNKDPNLKIIADILHLSAKSMKKLNTIFCILFILIGVFILVNAVLYRNGVYWIYFSSNS